MRSAPQRRKTILETATGAMVLASALWVSCQPGELPCDSSPDWRAICGPGAGGTGGTGGMGGAGGGGPGAPSAMTAVADCAKWPTLGDMDKFFGMRCAAGTSCHVTTSAPLWTDMQTKDVWQRLKDKKPITSCNAGALINSTNWRDSVLWMKVQPGGAMAMCPAGAMSPGATMPPQAGFEPKLDPVSDEERKCLEGFLRAATGQ
jgi:hypothetical protein